MLDTKSLLMLERRVCLLTLLSLENKCKPFFHNDVKKFDDIGQVVAAKMTADILEPEVTPHEQVQDFRIDLEAI
nr:hypothetical protein [Tanacetum cinerariifolium]